MLLVVALIVWRRTRLHGGSPVSRTHSAETNNTEMIQTLFGTPEPTFLEKMKQAVTRTRENLSERIDEALAFTKEIDRSTLDDLEAILITADLGTKTTEEILSKLREKADRKQIKDGNELKRLIKEQIQDILKSTPPKAASR